LDDSAEDGQQRIGGASPIGCGQFEVIGTTVAGSINQSVLNLSGDALGVVGDATSIAGSIGAMTGAFNNGGGIGVLGNGNFAATGRISITVVGALNASDITTKFTGPADAATAMTTPNP
jgi:hypothetical protein